MFEILLDSYLHLIRLIPTLFKNNRTVSPYQVGNIGRRAIGAHQGIIHLIHQHGNGYILRGYGLARYRYPFLVARRLVNRVPVFIIGIGAWSSLYRMGFPDINNDEMNIIPVFVRQVIIGSAPLPEWRSGEGTEYHHHRFFTKQLRQVECIPVNIP